jgi:hypothetical protein
VRKLRMSGFLVGEIDVRIVNGSHFGIRARPASVVAGGGRFEPLTSAVQRARHLQRRVRVLPRLLHRSLAARWPAAADPQYQDRIEPSSPQTHLLTSLRGRPEPGRGGRAARPSTTAMPGALVGLAYRDAATPRLRPSLGRAPHATAGEESLP